MLVLVSDADIWSIGLRIVLQEPDQVQVLEQRGAQPVRGGLQFLRGHGQGRGGNGNGRGRGAPGRGARFVEARQLVLVYAACRR